MLGHPVSHALEARVDTLRSRLEAHTPLLSLYLELDAEADAAGTAAARADAALRDLPLPRSVRERIVRRLRHLLPEAGIRTVVLFAGEDPRTLFETVQLRVLLPLPGGRRDVLARWGEPLLAPLQLLLQTSPPVLALYLDEERARWFELHLGEITERTGSVRPLDPGGWRPLSESSTGMPGTPARGGSGRDRFRQRQKVWTRRFHADLAAQLERELRQRPTARLLLLGASGATHRLAELLPAALQEQVLAHHAATADPDAPAPAWLPGLLGVLTAARREFEGELIAQLEREVRPDPAATLAALLGGDLACLILPADSDLVVYRCAESGQLAADLAGLRRTCPESSHDLVSLKEVVPDLLERHRTELVLLQDRAAARLEASFAGVAGLLRRKAVPRVEVDRSRVPST